MNPVAWLRCASRERSRLACRGCRSEIPFHRDRWQCVPRPVSFASLNACFVICGSFADRALKELATSSNLFRETGVSARVTPAALRGCVGGTDHRWFDDGRRWLGTSVVAGARAAIGAAGQNGSIEQIRKTCLTVFGVQRGRRRGPARDRSTDPTCGAEAAAKTRGVVFAVEGRFIGGCER